MEQEPRICPLCGSPVRLFYINFSEKLLMCEDPNCDFPFGYEELQVVTDESELRENFDTASSISLGPYNGMSAASSVISTAAWSDIERLNRIYDSEDCMADSRMSYTSDAVRKQRELRETQKEIQENLDDIKKLNEELNLLKCVDKGSIQNDEWLQNLMILQGLSGRQLLKKDEIEKLKKKEPDFGMGELKININTVPNDIGLINIEIINEDNELQNKNGCEDIQENKLQIHLDEIDDMDEESYIDDQEEKQNDENINLANHQQAVTLNESIKTVSNIQENEIENQVNVINLEETSSNDTLADLNINFNEINNFVTDSDISYDDTNLVDVKTVVINNNSFTLIELKGTLQDINSQNEIENIEGDIQNSSANITLDTSISSIDFNDDNINEPNMSEQEIESAQNQDIQHLNNLTVANKENSTKTNSNENSTTDESINDTNSNDNYLESRKVNESTELETSTKETKLLLETEPLLQDHEENRTSTNSDPNISDSNTQYESNEKSCENQEDTMDNPKKSDSMNSLRDQKDLMNNSKDTDLTNDSIESELTDNCKESESEVKMPKKRGRPKKGSRLPEQPLRRSNRFSK